MALKDVMLSNVVDMYRCLGKNLLPPLARYLKLELAASQHYISKYSNLYLYLQA